ncbi:MAG: hypothetical protein JNN12_00930 [Bacteroidetes Order II. Incertae sedis bacterium]|nr:hypothetical protein [Bacteroidetes Order II. bacterium]
MKRVWMLLLIAGCSTVDPKLETPTEYTFKVPEGFPATAYRFENTPITQAGFELGRSLFYDGKLSRDGSISCADCHQQEAAFSHFDHDVSHGIDDRLGTRNAPALFNLAWHSDFFWDGGVHDLDLQPPSAIMNANEMDESLDRILEKLRKDHKYPALFRAAYGTEEVTTARFLKSLSQFMLLMISSNSKYDRYMRKEAGVTFTADEQEGLRVFNLKCATCHPAPLFTDLNFRNNGLKPTPNPDLGRALITLRDEDRLKFKVPSLRNITESPPYMHDGRFSSLERVLEHYNSGVQATENLDPLLNQNGRRGIALSDTEKRVLIAFMKTLKDDTFLSDKRFSHP